MATQLDQVKDENLVVRSTLERRTMYKSMRMAEPRYVSWVSPNAKRIEGEVTDC
jgi:non-specific serine/threonine protein kinase